MAPIKFEENIKDKLEKRTLQSSADAWNKLSQRLETQEKKKQIKPIWWLGFAASIVGILFVATQFFNNETTEIITPKIVETPKVIKQEKSSQIAVDNIEIIKEVSNENDLNKELEANQIIKKSTIIESNLNNDAVVVALEKSISKEKPEITEPINIIQENLTFEEQKIQDVVAQVQALKENNTTVTDEDINALLEQAQKEIRLQQLYNENTGVVDANLLLQDVESDLEQSFRNKVFEAIKASYGTVKTAVAQRNN